MKNLFIIIIACFTFNANAITKVIYKFPTGEEVEISRIRMKLDGLGRYTLNKKVSIMKGVSLIRSSSIEVIDGEKCITVKAKKEGQIFIMAGDVDYKVIFCSEYIEYGSDGYRRAFIFWSNDKTKDTEMVEDMEYSSFLDLIKEHLGIDDRDRGNSYTVNKNPSSVITCRAEGFVASLLLPHKVLCSPLATLGERYTPQTNQSCTKKYVWSTDRSVKSETCLKLSSIKKSYITTDNRGCTSGFTKSEFKDNQSDHYKRTVLCVR